MGIINNDFNFMIKFKIIWLGYKGKIYLKLYVFLLKISFVKILEIIKLVLRYKL